MKDACIALCVDNKGIKTVVRADYGLLDPGDMIETDVGSLVIVTKVVFDPDGDCFGLLEQVVTVRNAIKVWRKHWEAEEYMYGD